MIFGAPKPAYAGFEFCNNSGEKLSISFVQHYDHFRSRGWWDIEDDACKNVYKGELIGDRHRYWIAKKYNTYKTISYKGVSDADYFCFNMNKNYKIDHIRYPSSIIYKDMLTGKTQPSCEKLGRGFRKERFIWQPVRAGDGIFKPDDDHCKITLHPNGRYDSYCD